MELQIQDLVSSIKKDGIESANREAAQILADAKAQAEKKKPRRVISSGIKV